MKWILGIVAAYFVGLTIYLAIKDISVKPHSERAIVPVAVRPVEEMLSIDTINPAVLRGFIQSVNPKVYNNLADEIVRASLNSAKKYHLSAILILAIAKTESEFDINAVSKIGARGLMQVNPKVWKDILIKRGIISNEFELHDPTKNIESGCLILRDSLDQQHSLDKALNGYLGADSMRYRAEIDRQIGGILMLGISSEINAPYRSQPAKAGG
jgi:soluble lytic murein transglycosylase-like protein